MPIKYRHTDGTWKDVTTGEFRVRNPTVATDWIYAAKVQICWEDTEGGPHRWIDSGYKGVPNIPPTGNKTWSYSSMTVVWTPPTDNGVPISGYRVTVKEEPSGPTRTFNSGPTVREQTFSVEHDTKYTVSTMALGDTGVPGNARILQPWIGHPKVSTFANVTKWKSWASDPVYFNIGPPDTSIYRNVTAGIYIPAGFKAIQLQTNLTGKYPWVPEDGFIINSGTRSAEFIVAGAHFSNVAARQTTHWEEYVTLGPQTTAGLYGLRLTGPDWSTFGGVKALTGGLRAFGQESYIERVETVTVAEKVNTYW